MWRFTLSFVLSSVLTLFLWFVVGGEEVRKAGGITVFIAFGMIVVCGELLIQQIGSGSELKAMIRSEPRFAGKLYRCGVILGAGSCAAAMTIASLLGKSWNSAPIYVTLLPFLLPMAGFVAGLTWVEQKVKSWSARPTPAAKTGS